MKELIPLVDTPDGLFHDGNPLTGSFGTIVSASHLNNVQNAVRSTQSEILTVLQNAGIQATESKKDQLFTAINALVAIKTPQASTAQLGVVQLNDAVNSTSTTQAATPNAVKKAYDLAASKLSSVPAASTTQVGITQLNDTVNSTSTTQAATANAVKKAYDKATEAAGTAAEKVSSVNGQKGDVNLNFEHVGALSAAGGTLSGSLVVRANHGGIEIKTTAEGVSNYLLGKDHNSNNNWHVGYGGETDILSLYNYKTGAGLSLGTTIASHKSLTITGSVTPTDYTNFSARYLSQTRRGSRQYIKPENWIANYEVPDGYITGFVSDTNDGNIRFAGWYYRIHMHSIGGSWINSANS